MRSDGATKIVLLEMHIKIQQVSKATGAVVVRFQYTIIIIKRALADYN